MEFSDFYTYIFLQNYCILLMNITISFWGSFVKNPLDMVLLSKMWRICTNWLWKWVVRCLIIFWKFIVSSAPCVFSTHVHPFQKLTKYCMSFAGNHVGEVIHTRGFDQWDENTAKDFIKECHKRKLFRFWMWVSISVWEVSSWKFDSRNFYQFWNWDFDLFPPTMEDLTFERSLTIHCTFFFKESTFCFLTSLHIVKIFSSINLWDPYIRISKFPKRFCEILRKSLIFTYTFQ